MICYLSGDENEFLLVRDLMFDKRTHILHKVQDQHTHNPTVLSAGSTNFIHSSFSVIHKVGSIDILYNF